MIKYRISPRKKQMIKQKQNNFVLDCINPLSSKMPSYNSLKDRYLKYYVIRVSKKKLSQNNKSNTQDVKKNSSVSKHLKKNSLYQDNLKAYYNLNNSNNRPSVNKNQFDEFLKKKKQGVLYDSLHQQYKNKSFPSKTQQSIHYDNLNQNNNKINRYPLEELHEPINNNIERLKTQIEQIQQNQIAHCQDKPQVNQIDENKKLSQSQFQQQVFVFQQKKINEQKLSYEQKAQKKEQDSWEDKKQSMQKSQYKKNNCKTKDELNLNLDSNNEAENKQQDQISPHKRQSNNRQMKNKSKNQQIDNNEQNTDNEKQYQQNKIINEQQKTKQKLQKQYYQEKDIKSKSSQKKNSSKQQFQLQQQKSEDQQYEDRKSFQQQLINKQQNIGVQQQFFEQQLIE